MGDIRPGPPRTELTVVELDGHISVLVAETGVVHSLNASASDVWQLLDGTRPVEDIVDRLLERYDVERERLHEDVERLVADLTSRRLLEPRA